MIHLVWFAAVLLLALLAIGLWQRERIRRQQFERQLRRRTQEMGTDLDTMAVACSQMTTALASSHYPTIVVDHDLGVQLANQRAIETFGPFQPGMSLINLTRTTALEQIAQDAWDIGPGGDLERTVRIEDRPFKVRAEASGEYVGLSLEDVTEVQRLSRARQDMIANLSHELRTPIASIRLLAETLTSPAGQAPGVADNLIAKIVSEVEVLEQMTLEMLDLSSIESGQQPIRLEPIPISDILVDPLARLEDQAARKMIEIKIKHPGRLSILADRALAERAVLNVLHNAIKFSSENGVVSISAAYDTDDGMVTLSIRDSGPGLHPQDLERIFERFYRADRARSTPGTGLGLSIAHHIMRAHGGSISAENLRPPEVGAVFHLRFRSA
ncbi:MAG: ATP-binding protein [Anaerolineales bacterium]|jgi:two-component system phosphate regulon sensor histidine kinase PhoR